MSLKELFSGSKSMLQEHRRRWVIAFFAGLFLTIVACLLPIEKIAFLIMVSVGWLIYLPSIGKLTQLKDVTYIANAPLNALDERQQQVRLKGSEYAFTVMTTLVSVLVVYFSLSDLFQVYLLKIQSTSVLIMTSFTAVVFLRLALIAWLESDPIADEVLSSVG